MKSAQSSYRDRTQEFQNVAERLKKSFSSSVALSAPNAAASGSGSKQEGPRSTVAIQSEFNKRASKIGYGIHQTSQKLAKLAKYALDEGRVWLGLKKKIEEGLRKKKKKIEADYTKQAPSITCRSSGSLLRVVAARSESAKPSVLRQDRGEEKEDEDEYAGVLAQPAQDSTTWRVATRENHVLCLDMDSMRTWVHQLGRECSKMKKVITRPTLG